MFFMGLRPQEPHSSDSGRTTIVTVSDLTSGLKSTDAGETMYRLVTDLYPFCRSITGNGVRETLRLLQAWIPLTMHEVPTGTSVFDWTVPREWNIRDAYLKNSRGQRVIDFQQSNLHVLGYSIPVARKIKIEELKNHLFTLPAHPDWIPYRTSYYAENWGFCLSHNQFLELSDSEYEVCIDATLVPGSLTYGEYYLEGEVRDEILISSHICHPSLCNDNLSGLALTTLLAQHLTRVPRRYSYVFLFIPSTIGSITWLSLNESRVSNIKHGLVVANVGDPGKSTYKKTRRGNAEIDIAVQHTLKHSRQDFDVLDFVPYGYDERQYCSPAFDLPVGCFMRTPHGRYPEYHTSADNLDFIRPQFLADSLLKILSVLSVLENNRVYLNQSPKCEPQLGKRGLYRGYPVGGADDLALLWVLNLSDGNHTLLDIAERSGIAFNTINKAAEALLKCKLLSEVLE
jgi:aminopeptidase-like protein